MNREKALKEKLEKQQYVFTGRHSAIKTCTWTKKSITDKGVCYKEDFYGIKAHRCAQMSVSVGYCQNSCVFCWREIDNTLGRGQIVESDDPDEIISRCIEGQKKLLNGFGGHDDVNIEKLKEAMDPMHFAISLTGDALLYPKLSELISKLHRQGKSTFLVTNGLEPDILETLEMPTQLYVSLDAPNEELFKRIDNSVYEDAWTRLNKTLSLLKDLKTRTAVRITLIKSSKPKDPICNMVFPEQYGKILEKSSPLFVEVKAYMFIGSSRIRLDKANMPYHEDVVAFAKDICKHSSYKIIDEKKESRVVLLMKEDIPDRIMKF